MNEQNKGKLKYFLWRSLSLFLTAGFLIPILGYKTQDPTYWFIFLPAVALCLFPFFVSISYVFQALVTAKHLGIQREFMDMHPECGELCCKAGRWLQIALLTWICVFAVIAAVAIHYTRAEREQNQWKIVKSIQPQTLSQGSSKHTLLYTLDTAIRYLLPISLIALVLGAVILVRSLLQRRWKRKKETTIFWRILPFVSIASFVIPILLMSILGGLMQKIVRDEVKSFLDKVPSQAVVKVDGQVAKNPNQIISVLSKLAPMPAHHSHDIKRIRVEVAGQKDGLTIELGRDSDRRQEYWVFYLGYRHTSVNEIGRITTNLFDDY